MLNFLKRHVNEGLFSFLLKSALTIELLFTKLGRPVAGENRVCGSCEYSSVLKITVNYLRAVYIAYLAQGWGGWGGKYLWHVYSTSLPYDLPCREHL